MLELVKNHELLVKTHCQYLLQMLLHLRARLVPAAMKVRTSSSCIYSTSRHRVYRVMTLMGKLEEEKKEKENVFRFRF